MKTIACMQLIFWYIIHNLNRSKVIELPWIYFSRVTETLKQ